MDDYTNLLNEIIDLFKAVEIDSGKNIHQDIFNILKSMIEYEKDKAKYDDYTNLLNDIIDSFKAVEIDSEKNIHQYTGCSI